MTFFPQSFPCVYDQEPCDLIILFIKIKYFCDPINIYAYVWPMFFIFKTASTDMIDWIINYTHRNSTAMTKFRERHHLNCHTFIAYWTS